MYAEDMPPVAAAANVLGPPGASVAGAGTEAADALCWRGGSHRYQNCRIKPIQSCTAAAGRCARCIPGTANEDFEAASSSCRCGP